VLARSLVQVVQALERGEMGILVSGERRPTRRAARGPRRPTASCDPRREGLEGVPPTPSRRRLSGHDRARMSPRSPCEDFIALKVRACHEDR
jgi:hypothetical protein